MKANFLKLMSVVGVLGLSLCGVPAQETNELEQLRKEMREMRKLVQQLEQKVETLEQKKSETVAVPAKTSESPPGAATTEQLKELNEKVDSVVEAQKKERPSEFNPSIGLVSETLFSYDKRRNDQTGNERAGGFDAFQRSVELVLAASVDPFAKGYAVINASADSATGEANLGVEEAALQTTSLPWNLELKAGRFFGEFGKLSFIHDHELPFVNRPLVLDQYIGGESRTDGAQLNWLPPIGHYVSVTLGFGSGFGGDSPLNNPGAYRSLSGFNYFGRVSTYFDLTPNVQLETGISGLINPSTKDRGGVDGLTGPGGVLMTEKERRVAAFDLKLSYVPLRNNQFQRLDWGTEVLYSDSRYLFDPDGTPGNADDFGGSIGSVGLYSYVTYKWHRQWSAGFLFDWVQSAQDKHDETFAYSPYLTFALSHWNQLRLQYTHTDHNSVSGLPSDDAIYLQWAWIIGAHSHGWQAR